MTIDATLEPIALRLAALHQEAVEIAAACRHLGIHEPSALYDALLAISHQAGLASGLLVRHADETIPPPILVRPRVRAGYLVIPAEVCGTQTALTAHLQWFGDVVDPGPLPTVVYALPGEDPMDAIARHQRENPN